jgi:hypothetical protein
LCPTFVVKAHGNLVAIPDTVIVVEIDEDWVVSFVLIWGMHFNSLDLSVAQSIGKDFIWLYENTPGFPTSIS